MLSNKKIVCPNNLITVAKKSGIIDAAIVNAGEIFPMESVHKAVEHNLINPIFIGNEIISLHSYGGAIFSESFISLKSTTFEYNKVGTFDIGGSASGGAYYGECYQINNCIFYRNSSYM